MRTRQIVEEPRRITSAANVWADVGSRPEKGGAVEVERQAREMGFSVRHVAVPPRGWRSTSGLQEAEPTWAVAAAAAARGE